MSNWRTAVGYAMAGGVPKRSLVVAAIVGTILNLINQGDALLAGRDLIPWKILLTYAVPYCVATYGAVSLRLKLDLQTGTGRYPAASPRKNNAGDL